MIVLSIDPGSSNPKTEVSHTGIVLLDGTTLVDSWAIPNGIDGFREWGSHHIDGDSVLTDAGSWVWVDFVVCEQFVDRQVMGADRSPLLIEGAVRFLWPDVVLSPPGGYKTAVPDYVLKKLGLWDFGAKDHHADRVSAARHAIRYLKNMHDPDVITAF